MKKVLLFEQYIGEGKGWAKLMKAVRSGSKSGPWSIVSIEGGKVVNQELVNVMDLIPAHYEDVKKRFPNAKMSIEDNEGMSVYNESVINEAEKTIKGNFGVKKVQTLIDKYGRDNGLFFRRKSDGKLYGVGSIFLDSLEKDFAVIDADGYEDYIDYKDIDYVVIDESLVTEAKNTIGLAFKDENDYNGFVEFIEDEGGKIFKNIGWDNKTRSWEVIMDVKVLDDIYGEGHPGNKESGWYGALPGDFESVIIEGFISEAFIGPFVFNDTMSDEELKEAYKRPESKVAGKYEIIIGKDPVVTTKIAGFEREGDSTDSLYLMDDDTLKPRVGTFIVKNSDMPKLEKGTQIKCKTSKGEDAKIKRIGDL